MADETVEKPFVGRITDEVATDQYLPPYHNAETAKIAAERAKDLEATVEVENPVGE